MQAHRLFWMCCLVAMGWTPAWGVEREMSVICSHGDLHQRSPAATAPGSPGAHEAAFLDLGPSKTVWLQLPSGATLAPGQLRPIPVPNLSAARIEVLVRRNGRDERVQVAVSEQEADGRTRVQLIRVRTSTYSYALPEGCRLLAPEERGDYAQALLNNASCLMPADLRRALRRIPGTPPLLAGCGWEADARLAMHLLGKAADRGSVDAGWVLSQFYLGSLGPEFRDLRAAYLQLSQTGGLGHASADLMAGIMRWRGNGQPAEGNAKAAFPILLPHARQGSREAQGIIGTMYLTGDGVPEDRVQALAWCSLAAAEAPLMYSDPVACRDSAANDLDYDQVLRAKDLAVEIHNGTY